MRRFLTVISGFKNLIKLIVINIPAILMIVGFVLIVIAFFKISQIAGLLASGVFLVILAILLVWGDSG